MVREGKVCGNPTCKNVGVHQCSGCSDEIYCSKECQKIHWATHKTTCAGKVKAKAAKPKKVPKQNAMPTPTPEQLKEQASIMRKHPEQVRRANPALANMTDEQIRQYADQLEMASKDPNMMKEIERMSKLSNSERETLQVIQEGLAGTREMNSAWADSTIQSLKTNPALFKSMMKGRGAMMGGVSDEQVESFIDMAASMDARILKFIFNAFKFIGAASKPVMEYYNKAEQYTLGLAKYVLMGIAGTLIYYWAVFTIAAIKFVYTLVVGLIFGKAVAGAATTGAATVVNKAAESIAAATFEAAVKGPTGGLDEVASYTGHAAAAAAAAAAHGFGAGGSGSGGASQKKIDADSPDAEFEF